MPSASRARDALDREGLIDFTRRLVRVKSVNQPEAGFSEAAAVEEVLKEIDAFGWKALVEEVAPGRPNVIVAVHGQQPGKTLLFEGHTDVVTEGDRDEWTVDPYGADLIDDRIYGRGSADMKGGLAAMIYATRALEVSGAFSGTIKLAILCDEEEMMIGAHHFVEQGHADGVDGAIICEPEAGEVCTVQKGAVRVRIDLDGDMAHGAMPHKGNNPIAAASQLVVELSKLEADLQAEMGEHPHLGLPYITPTHVEAGSLPQINVIPGSGLLTLDMRTVPGIEHSELVDQIKALTEPVAEETGVRFNVSVLVDRPATETPRDDPIVRAVAEAHESVTGEPAMYGGVPGSTDGTILWRDAGLPVVVYGPGGKWIAHQADEFVEIGDLITHAEVYIEAATRFLAG